MSKSKDNKSVFSYRVTMLVHIVGDDAEKARKQLDEQGGIVTSREVELLNTSALYKEQE